VKSVKVLLIGPQGSGKSTQSRLLAEYLNVPFIETGQIFRDLAKEESDLGKKIKEILDKGEMVPDDITADLVRERVARSDCQNGFVINGYPRNLNQTKLLKLEFGKVFSLEVGEEVVLSRLLKRAREDDTRELIKKRLFDYNLLTRPVLDYFRNLGILESINGERTVEEVQEDLRSSLNG